MRPTILDDLGLISTITWYMRQFSEQFGSIRLTPQIEVREEDIPETLKIVIYRVLQESLHNAAKHSEATEITIGLKSDTQRILLEVADNGCGFDVQKTLSWENPLISPKNHILRNHRLKNRTKNRRKGRRYQAVRRWRSRPANPANRRSRSRHPKI